MNNINKEIRAYIRTNSHLTDEIVAEKFNVSVRSVNANKAHITMGTDTDNPQARAKSTKKFKKSLTLIKTKLYELRIDEHGQFSRIDLIAKTISKIDDTQAKNIMLKQLK